MIICFVEKIICTHIYINIENQNTVIAFFFLPIIYESLWNLHWSNERTTSIQPRIFRWKHSLPQLYLFSRQRYRIQKLIRWYNCIMEIRFQTELYIATYYAPRLTRFHIWDLFFTYELASKARGNTGTVNGMASELFRVPRSSTFMGCCRSRFIVNSDNIDLELLLTAVGYFSKRRNRKLKENNIAKSPTST